MSKCPNCGRDALRTEDWACQWCGYPLLSTSYKKIPKTHKQLREERLHKPEPIQEPELEPSPESMAETEAEPTLESQRKLITERKQELETVQKPEPGLEPELTAESDSDQVQVSSKEQRLELEPEVELIHKGKSELEPARIELTVDELFSACETDEVAADAKFANKFLRLTGVVSMIDVKDILDTHHIRLIGDERGLLESVQCMFDKKHAPLLEQLEKGQTVTVYGKYVGSVIAVRMIDCVLA
jgi:ribosomal protein L37E